MNKTKQCCVCGHFLQRAEFWTHKADDRIWKEHQKREYLFHKCKECCQATLEYDNLNSILELLKAFDVPYIEEEWNKMFRAWGKKSIGRYLSLMRLFDFYKFGFDDSDFLNECYNQRRERENKKLREKKEGKMNKKYKVIAICGKSASGKDTYLQQALNHLGDKAHEIISHTTRPPRESEINGKNYYFITEEDFTTKLANNEMLEWATYRNWCYGTAIEALNQDKINIGVFNRKGIDSLSKREDIDLFVVLMLAGGKTRLLRSLNREEFPDVDEIVRRYKADEEEWKDFKNFHFMLSNEGQGVDPSRCASITDRILEEAECLWAKETN